MAYDKIIGFILREIIYSGWMHELSIRNKALLGHRSKSMVAEAYFLEIKSTFYIIPNTVFSPEIFGSSSNGLAQQESCTKGSNLAYAEFGL